MVVHAKLRVLLLVALPLRIGAARERQGYTQGKSSSVAAETTASAVNAEMQNREAAFQGTELRGRYVLQELQSIHQVPGVPGVSFPNIPGYSDSINELPENLGTGSFGDTWKAWDSALEKHVAIKIFYDQKKRQYITWPDATPQQKRDLAENKNECQAIINIVAAAEQMGADGENKQYLCTCFAEHVSDGVNKQQPVFLVLEMCGKDLRSGILNPGMKGSPIDVKKARDLMHQFMNGLFYLENFQVPLMHHDLKPENVCVNDEGTLKIIDWGGLLAASPSNMLAPAIATPTYMPPETFGTGYAFRGNAWTYDIYAAGLIYAELICPQVTWADWFQVRPVMKPKRWKPAQVILARCPHLTPYLAEDIKLILSMLGHYSTRPSPKSVSLYLKALTGTARAGDHFHTGPVQSARDDPICAMRGARCDWVFGKMTFAELCPSMNCLARQTVQQLPARLVRDDPLCRSALRVRKCTNSYMGRRVKDMCPESCKR